MSYSGNGKPEAAAQIEISELPPNEGQRLQDMLREGETVVFAQMADLTLSGQYGMEYLVLTNRRVLALGASRVIEVDLGDVVRVSTIDLQGNSVLRVATASRAVDLVRYSRSLGTKFAAVPLQIEELVQAAVHEERTVVPPEERWKSKRRESTHRCPQCGNVIPRYMGVCPLCLDRRKLVRRLLVYVLPHWRAALAAFLLLFAATFLSLTPPLINRTMVDHVFLPAISEQAVQSATAPGADAAVDVAQTSEPAQGDLLVRLLSPIARPGTRTLLLVLVGLMFLIHFVSSLMQALRRYLISWLGQNITYDLRNTVYTHLQSLSLGYFAKEETGRIMHRITGDVRRLQDFLSEGI